MFLATRSIQSDPAADFVNVGNRINRLLNEALGGFDRQYRNGAVAAWVPPVDIVEADDGIRIMAEVPGVRPEDVQISLEGNLLTIHGQKQQIAEERTERVHRYERTHGAFERTFTLPATVNATTIKATSDLGLLTITLPKVEHARPRQIQIEVTSAQGLLTS
jgi:HSP20 family protein